MTDKIAGIGFEVDVSQLQRAVKSLNDLRNASDDAANGMGKFGDAESKALTKAKGIADAALSQSKSFKSLESVLDPTASKMRTLTQASKDLDKLWSKGLIDDNRFFDLSETLETQINALKKSRLALTEEGRAAAAAAKEKDQARLAGERFVQQLRSQSELMGKSSTEMLQMKAAQLGVSASAAPLISNMERQAQAMEEAAQAAKAKALADKEAARAEQQANASKANFINALEQEANALGKSRVELLEMKAAQLGVSQQAAPLINQLRGQTQQLKLAGLSAGQYNQAMRMLPAQITDVVTSVASGMPIWMVAIQQGGQIKDSFNGIGNAVKALTSLINPYIVAAGALVGVLGAMGKAAWDYEKASSAMTNAIILSGNYAGTTTSQLQNMVQKIAQTSEASLGTIQSVATMFVKSGKYTNDQIAMVTKTTANWAAATGESADSIKSSFDKIITDPVKGLADLNKEFNFLEPKQLKYIDNLSKTEGKTAAVTAATKIFADVMDDRMAKIADNATPLEKMWDDIKKWSSSAWHEVGEGTMAALNLLTDVVAGTVEQVRYLLNQGDIIIGEFVVGAAEKLSKIPGMANAFSGIVQAQKEVVTNAKQQNAELVKSIEERNARIAKGEQGYRDMMKKSAGAQAGAGYSSKTKDAVQKEADEIAKANQKKAKSTKVVVDQGTKVLEQYNQEIEALRVQLTVLKEHQSVNDTISQQRKTLWNEQARINSLEEAQKTRTLTVEEKSVLANKDKILALAEQKAQIGDQIKLQEQMNKRQDESVKYITDMQAKTEALNATKAMGNNDAAKYTEDLKLQADWIAKGGSLTDAAYLKMQQASDAYYEAEKAKRSDWQAGLTSGLANYGEEVTNVYADMQQVATAALDGMANQMTSFLTTGKASFKDFASSIIEMIVKMIAQMVIFNAISGATGGSTFSFAGMGSHANGGVVGSKGFAGGGFTGAGGKYDPAGVVHKGEFVMTKEATRRIGVGNLYKLMRGYASGGAVGSSGSSAATSAVASGGFAMGDVNVNINSGSDPARMEAGVRAIFTDMITKACSQGGEVYKFVKG